MPDQLPSAILDSSNSFDSLFALELDTKQRFDNILNQEQKPIDYPIPDYNKDFTPQGLPQDDLLNPNKMKGSLGEALFSADPRVAAYATDKLRANQSRLPVTQGVGVPDRFQYSKEMDKFLKGDYGYNPYMSLEDNEDFNYRYDYLSAGLAERIFKNVGVGLSRFVGSVVLKLGQTAGYLGSMVGNGIEEIFNGKENNFMADVADNSLSRWFEGLEEDMKNSNLLSVYKPRGWEDKGFFSKLGNGAFWTDEVADGAAFMGEMIASMYLLGGLGKVGGVGRLGATEINLTRSLGRLGSLGRYTGKSLDFALKTATGAENLSGIGRWAFATTSESAFEASNLFHSRKDQLRADRASGKNEYTDTEIEAIAGDSAAAAFKANLLILSASNAFANKFIFNPLFKRMGINSANPRGGLVSVSDATDNLDNLARASRREYTYGTWLGKKLDWKNSNSRLRFYGSRGLSAVAAEGFWEENAQLAAERLASVDNLSFSSFANKLGSQTLSALRGDDPEASTAIGLGAIIGVGGTTVVAKARGGDRLFQGERRKVEEDTQKAITIYEQQRRSFLNFQDIYVRDPQSGKPVLDSDGNMQIDEVKAAAILDGMNAFVSKQDAVSKVNDPLFRKHLQDQAMMDFVVAAKSAGIFDRSAKRFSSLGDLTQGELENLGFDPNTTVDTTYLQDSIKEFGKIYDSVQDSPAARRSKDDTVEDELSRKHALYKASATVYSTSKLINEFQSAMMDRDFPSAFSPDAEGNTSEIQTYNSLVYQKEAMEQWAELAKENGNFYDGFIRNETKRIKAEMDRLEKIMDDMMDTTDLNLQVTPRGFVVSTDKYSDLTPSAAERFREVEGERKERTIAKMRNDSKDTKAMVETEMNMDIENAAQRKHAQYTNLRAQYQYLVNKFGSIQDGIKNYKDYIKYTEAIQKKDGEKDAGSPPTTQPGQEPPLGTPTQPTASPTSPVGTEPTTPALTKAKSLEAEAVITRLTSMLSQARAVFFMNDPSTPPDYTVVATFIAENIQENRKAIETSLSNFVRDAGEIVMDQIRANTFDPKKNISVETYRVQSQFMDNLMDVVEDLELKNLIFDYMDSVDDAIKNYKPVVVELTDQENEVMEALAAIDLTNSKLAPYAAILQDPSSSNQDKKEALRYISDQMLAPATAEEVGTILGRRASQAIEDLGYPPPQETEALSELTAAEATAATNPALVAAMEAAGVTDEPLTKEQQIVAFFAGITADEGSKAKIRQYADRILAGEDPTVVLQGLGPSFTGPVNELVAIEQVTEQPPLPTPPEDYDITGPRPEPAGLKVGDRVIVNTKKDGISIIKEMRGDKALLEDGRQVALSNLTLSATEPVLPQQTSQPVRTQAEEATANTEGSGVQAETPPPPQEPPRPPLPAENSDEASISQENYIDVMVDNAIISGMFTFPQNMPEEIVMEGDKAKIVDGAIQLKTTSSDQQLQLLRQHNILKQMGERTNPTNFWSEDQNGNPLYKIRLEMAGFKNEAKYAPWVYNTAKGKISPQTGKPYLFPFIVAMVVDQEGNYIFFDNNGNVSDKLRGKPFGFPYVVEDYKSQNLGISRRGLQLGTGEPLNGIPGFLNDNPLQDLTTALQRGVELIGTIDEVASGKLSTYNVDNQGATWAKEPVRRTVEQMEKDGDITDSSTFVLTSGQYFEYASTKDPGVPTQKIKVGQPYLFDEKSGIKIPLRGKKIKDLTINGKPLIDGQLRAAIEGLSKDGRITIDRELATSESQELLENLFNLLRALVYSQNTPIFINESKTQISMLDQRPNNKSLMETEINYSTNISILSNPFDADTEGFSYDDFVRENFLSGAVPAELTKGQKSFEKLNRRIIFTLDRTHQEILDSIGAKADPAKTIRMKAMDFSKFVNKTYKRRGGTSTVTVTGYSDGKFTIAGPSGVITQSVEEFLKTLPNLEEVKLPAPTEEVQQDFDNNIRLSEQEQKELNERAKNITKEDLDNLDFNC